MLFFNGTLVNLIKKLTQSADGNVVKVVKTVFYVVSIIPEGVKLDEITALYGGGFRTEILSLA